MALLDFLSGGQGNNQQETDASGTSGLFGSIVQDAYRFATPYAQNLLGQSSTPAQVQRDTLTSAALNGSGPNDPTLASQSPQGLWDYITGGRVTGQAPQPNPQGQGGLLSGGNNSSIMLIAVVAIVAVFVMLKK